MHSSADDSLRVETVMWRSVHALVWSRSPGRIAMLFVAGLCKVCMLGSKGNLSGYKP